MASPLPFQRLLVGVAEDPRSDPAILMACELAQRWKGSLELLHATGPRESGWGALDLMRKATGVAETLTVANEILGDHLRKAFPDHRAEGRCLADILRVLPGRPAELMLERATGDASAIVFLGPHRRRGHIDFGSTARAVLASTTVPVWVQYEDPLPIKRILVAVDGSPASRPLLKLTAELAASFPAHVDILHTFCPPTFAYGVEDPMTPLGPTYVIDDLRREAKREFKALVGSQSWKVPFEAHFVEGEAAPEILARQESADLIVLGTHGRARVAAAVLGSVAYAVLGAAHRPVLVLPTHADVLCPTSG